LTAGGAARRKSPRTPRSRPVAALLATAICLLVPITGAQAKVKVTILGWTTQAGATSPQVRDGETIKTCLDMGNGQRSLYGVYEGRASRTRSVAC
jgi:hypothetical protein